MEAWLRKTGFESISGALREMGVDSFDDLVFLVNNDEPALEIILRSKLKVVFGL